MKTAQVPQTEGQKAFKKLQECIEGTQGNDIKWFMDREFFLKSLLNAFNTRYCSCVTPHIGTVFDPIFLVINGKEHRVDSVYMKPIKLQNATSVAFMVSLLAKDTKDSHEPIDILDKSIYLRDGIVDGLYGTTSVGYTAIESTKEWIMKNGRNQDVLTRYKLSRDSVPPYVVLIDNRDGGDYNGTPFSYAVDTTGLFNVVGSFAIIRSGFIPRSAVTEALATKLAYSKADNYISTLTDDQKDMLRNFLFGTVDNMYFEKNITPPNAVTKKWSLTTNPSIYAWDDSIMGNISLARKDENTASTPEGKLIDFLVNPSSIERKFATYGADIQSNQSTPKTGDKSVADTTTNQPTGNNAKPNGSDSSDDSESDDDDGTTGNQPAGGNNAKPGDGKQQIINNTSPSKSDPNFERLMKFNQLLAAVTPTQFDTKYLAIVKLLNMFNYVHCSEVSPDESHRIEPIFVEFEGNSYRVCRVFIFNNNQLVYECRTIDNALRMVSVKALGKLPQGAPFTAKSQPGEDTSFIYQPIDPIYGKIHYKSAPGVALKPTRTCIDTNGLYKFIGKERWYVDTRYVYRYEKEHTITNYEYKTNSVNATVFVANVDTNPLNQRESMRLFLFDENSVNTLINVINDQKQWIDLFGQDAMVDIQSTIGELKTVSSSIYKALSLPETSIFPVPDPIQQGGDIQTLIGQVPRAKLLYDALRDLETSVKEKASTIAFLEGQYKIMNSEFTQKFKLALPLLAKFANESQNDSYLDEYDAFADTYEKIEEESDEKIKNLKTGLGLKSAVFITNGMDVMVNKENYSEMIRSNVFKGKYNAELIISDNHGNEHLCAEFKHINTYTDENNKLVYGAMCGKNSQQIFHNETGNKMTLDNGVITINIKDEKGRVIRAINTSFNDTPKDSYLCMLKAPWTQLFLTRSTESDTLKVKMIVIDV